MRIGVKLMLRDNTDIRSEFQKILDFGMDNCQLDCWDMHLYTDEKATEIREISQDMGVDITALWCGWEGDAIWNYGDGPATLGLVPSSYRFRRIENLKTGSDFAKTLGVRDFITHAGFIPENPHTKEYHDVVTALKIVTQYCKKNNQNFLLETGQETPTTLMRAIKHVGTGNIGINLDPANLYIYGKGNAIDSVKIFGKTILGVHAKDGVYPSDPDFLGHETPMGEGMVNFPVFIQALKDVGYDDAITIEREIEGDKQIKDIQLAQGILEKLI